MSNEVVGIIAVFPLTLILFVLRHFYLSIGHTNKSRRSLINRFVSVLVRIAFNAALRSPYHR